MASASATIPVGYKQTEVGVIPEDWEIKKIGELFDIFSSSGINNPSDENYFLMEMGSVTEQGRLKINKLTKNSASPLLIYDLIMPTRDIGEGRIIGRVAMIDANNRYVIGNNLYCLRGKSHSIVPRFFHYLINSEPINRLLKRKMTKSVQLALNKIIVFEQKIMCPSSDTEQQIIANALFDSDIQIQALESLISKKRDIKQGIMQELLSGKTRLPGFSGHWKSEKLKNIGMTFGGLTGKSKDDFGSGSARYITFMNIMTNVVIDCNTLESVSVTKGETQNEVSLGDLFFNGSSESPEEVGMCSYLDEELHDVYLNSFCFGFRPNRNSKNDGRYLAYFFRNQEGRKLMKSLAQGSTRYNISKTALLSVDFLIPELSEQQAIAEVLSDMDAEIAALKQRLEKTKAIKQGMMQQLLTGRIRLVDPSTPVEASA
jgi:type I restriction enzyme, S subunit